VAEAYLLALFVDTQQVGGFVSYVHILMFRRFALFLAHKDREIMPCGKVLLNFFECEV
jgi:hypothetical protein